MHYRQGEESVQIKYEIIDLLFLILKSQEEKRKEESQSKTA
jgi:hypothetical protein